MYILICVIFIAELIIALQLILLIKRADKKICGINECVKTFNPLAKTCLEYVNCLSKMFNRNVSNAIFFIKKQQKRVIFKTITTFAIYTMLIFFKIKKIKLRKVFKLADAIRDFALEMVI